MNSIKIAHITSVDSSLCYLLLNQLRYLRHAGYDVSGISTDGKDVPLIEAADIRHIPITISRNITPLADLKTLMQLIQIMRREQFTIVHTHTPKPGLLGQIAARIAGVPIVVNTLHGFYFHEHMPAIQRRFYITLEKIAARCSDVILSQNREDLATAIHTGICPPDKIKHLGNGIDLTRFDPTMITATTRTERRAALGIPAEAPVVGFVGRLAGKRKGFLDFLAAGKIIAQQIPQTCFLIVGAADQGKPDAVHPDVAEDFGIAEQCHFAGFQPNAEIPVFYTVMDVLVLPSLFEGIPRSLMEGAAMGVPLVATYVKGNREVVKHRQNGLLVPLNNTAALSDAILDLLNNRTAAQQMSTQGRRMALQHFDERRVFHMIQQEYARLLRARNLPVPQPAAYAPATR